MLSRVFLEQLSSRPLDSQEMKACIGLADLYRADDVWMLNTGAILRFTNEPRDGGLIMAQLFPKNLEGDGPMARMLSLVDLCRAALANLTLYGVSGYLGADQALMRHAGESNRNPFLWIG